MTRRITDDQAPKSPVADEDIGTQAKDEVFDAKIPRGSDCPCQILGRCCIVEKIGWTTDLECGVLSEWLVAFQPLAIESTNQLPVRFRAGVPRI
jgi:hypothetical protein